MIAGGVSRGRWTDDDGRKALEAIHAQRTVNEIVNHRRNRLQSTTARHFRPKAIMRSADAAVHVAEGSLHVGSSEARVVAKLAAVDAATCGYTRKQYKTRRRQFRKV
jgi:hypothetical protein